MRTKFIALLLAALVPSCAFAQSQRVGAGISLTPRASAPTPANTPRVWVSNADDDLRYTDSTNNTITLGAAGAGGYSTVQDEGSALTARTVLNFEGTGVTCADASGKTTCTIAGGGGGTFATVYSQTTPANNRLSLKSAGHGLEIYDDDEINDELLKVYNVYGDIFSVWGDGPGGEVAVYNYPLRTSQGSYVEITDALSPISQALLRVKTNGGTEILTVKPAEVAAGAAGAGLVYDIANTRLKIGGPGSPTGRVHVVGNTGSNAYIRVDNSFGSIFSGLGGADANNTGWVGTLSNHEFVTRVNNTDITRVTATSYIPVGDATIELGTAAATWKSVAAAMHYGDVETVSFTATPTFTKTSGETKRIVLSASITSWTVNAGEAGQILTIEFIQNGTGGWTLGAPPANVLLAGGSMTLTATGNKRDVLTLRYDSTDAKWVEIGRALNL